jgi:hypothetical protein
METPRQIVERIARGKGTFTESFRRYAEEQAREGHGETLQIIQGTDEIRRSLANALTMYVLTRMNRLYS